MSTGPTTETLRQQLSIHEMAAVEPRLLFALNAREIVATRPEMDIDREMQLIAAGNLRSVQGRWEQAGGTDEKDMTEEEREEKRRRESGVQAMSVITLDSIVTQSLYDDFLQHTRSELERITNEYDTVAGRIQTRDIDIGANAERLALARATMVQRQTEFDAQRADMETGEARLRLLTSEAELYRRISERGGAIDAQGNEYVRIEDGPNGEQRFALTDESGHTTIRGADGLLTGETLASTIAATEAQIVAQTVTVETQRTIYAETARLHSDFVAGAQQLITDLERERQELIDANSTDREQLDKLTEARDASRAALEYLERPDTVTRMQNGSLTVEEMQQGVGVVGWNVFRNTHKEEYADLPPAPMNEEQTAQYNSAVDWLGSTFGGIFSGISNAAGAVTQTVSSTAQFLGETVSSVFGGAVNAIMPATAPDTTPDPIPVATSDATPDSIPVATSDATPDPIPVATSDTTPDPVTIATSDVTPITAADADGQGIRAKVSLSGAFATAHSPETDAEATPTMDIPSIDPSIVAAQNYTLAAPGLRPGRV